MVDSVQVFTPGFRVLDANGNPVSGAQILFEDAGTSTARTMYSDDQLTTSLGSTIWCDSGGRPVSQQGGTATVQVYTGTSRYKVTIKSSDGATTYFQKDNMSGALDTSGFTPASLTLQMPVTAKTADFSIVDGDRAKLLEVDPTSGDITATLPAAVTVGDDWIVYLRHTGSTNTVKVVTPGSETIERHGVPTTSIVLIGRGETAALVSNGSNFRDAAGTDPFLISNAKRLTVADRLSTPPVSPAAGAFYLLTASPTGDWSSFAEHDIVQADGSGGWRRFHPDAFTDWDGWVVYVLDEKVEYILRDGAWAIDTATSARAGKIELAEQSEMESASSTQLAVTPGTQHHHPGHPKVAGLIQGSDGSALFDYGIDTCTNTGTMGQYTITFDTDFSSTNFAPLANAFHATGAHYITFSPITDAGEITVNTYNNSGIRVQPTYFSITIFGDQ